ncbi:hypothetical protein PIB30_103838 [Stylosanthes scabra]|uniref:Uncharacterized protein n=1 Tax=Stylosanthes scabra TaxID=79078 RepID=A0ABU6V0M0_9FABA|nr:hypothetical protein [Stylosanthes scabra]
MSIRFCDMPKDWMDLSRYGDEYIDGVIKFLEFAYTVGEPAICQRNKKNKGQQKFPHRMGPINFARVWAELRKSKGNNEEPQRKSSRLGKLLVNQKRKLSGPYLGKNSRAELAVTADL